MRVRITRLEMDMAAFLREVCATSDRLVEAGHARNEEGERQYQQAKELIKRADEVLDLTIN